MSYVFNESSGLHVVTFLSFLFFCFEIINWDEVIRCMKEISYCEFVCGAEMSLKANTGS